MKRITASEARRDWFRLLDEVADGQVVTIVRNGRRIVIRREESKVGKSASAPDYSKILQVPNAGSADMWNWDWDDAKSSLKLRERKRR